MVKLPTSDTRTTTHTYTVDWNPESITWSIDGKSMRTLNKADTWNSTTNAYAFPQTPSRIQLSLWPAGLQSNGQGTVDWAGGLVNWDSEYMQNGYYYAMVNDVNIECYEPPSGYTNNGDKAYYYMDYSGTNQSVAIGNNNTILSSFMATGDNPSFNPNAKPSGSSKSASASSSSASMSATPESVPGISGGGNAQTSGDAPTGESNGDASGSSSNSGSSGSGTGSSSSQSSSSSGSSGFSQGASSDGTGSSSDAPKIVAGSAVALIGFFIAALML